MSDIHVTRYDNCPRLTDLNESETICRLFGITEDDADEGDIAIIDRDTATGGDLVLLHYLKNNPKTNHVHGTIVDISNPDNITVVAHNFPYPQDVSGCVTFTEDPDGLGTYVTKMIEGTTIRIYIHPRTNQVTLSTAKRINGFNGKWNDLEFGKTFLETCGVDNLEYFRKFLVTNDGRHTEDVADSVCLFFVLRHPLNRIVCRCDEPSVTFIGIFDENMSFSCPDRFIFNNDEANDITDDGKNNIKIMKDIFGVPVCSAEDINKAASELKWEESPGLLILNLSDHGRIVVCQRLAAPGYDEKRALRGNEPNLRMRYLDLYFRHSFGELNEFEKLFSDRQNEWAVAQNNIEGMMLWLKHCFKTRYIYEKYLRLPACAHYVISRAEKIYLPGVKTIRGCIAEIMSTSNAQQLNSILKCYLQSRVD